MYLMYFGNDIFETFYFVSHLGCIMFEGRG